MSKRKHSFLEDILRYARCIPSSNLLSWEMPDDRDIELAKLGANALTLCARDLFQQGFSTTDCRSWLYTLYTTGSFDLVISDFKRLDVLLMHKIGENLSIGHFLSGCCIATRILLGRLRWVLTSCLVGIDDDSLAKMHQLFSICSRMTFRSHPDAEENTLKKWKDTYYYVSNPNLPLATDYMVDCVTNWFSVLPDPMSEYSPHHSAGSVMEHNGKHKLDFLQRRMLTNGPIQRFLAKRASIPIYPTPELHTTVRYTYQMYVPKGVDTRRIVEPEPVELMFCQHGLASSINYVLDRSLSRHYARRDSGVNRRKAGEASETRLYDTLDLSSASDSNRWNLVRSLFSRLPKWQRYLAVVRSKISILPDGSYFPKVSVGSMGCPMTFPLEVVTFCALIEEAAHRLERSLHSYYVYGDDLIVPHWLTDKLIEVLTEYGFIVNIDKSYMGDTPFRESCGGDYLNGRDITPFRISRHFVLPNGSPKSVLQLVDSANGCYSLLPLVRLLFLSYVPKGVPYSEFRNGPLVLKGTSVSNSQLERLPGGHKDWQYDLVRSMIPSFPMRKIHQYNQLDDIRYWEWLESHKSTHDSLQVKKGRSAMTISEDWDLDDYQDRMLKLSQLVLKGEIDLRYRWVPDVYT